MTAYSFKKQFAEPIVAGTKGGTLAFWHKTHGCDLIYRGVFEGWHIRWMPLPEGIEL